MEFKMNTVLRVLNRDEIVVAGHRGMKSLYPENTLLSMQEALDAGVDMIETDLNLTKDKVVVVMHDNSIDRTTNGHGFIRDMTLEELKQYDTGGYMGKQFEGLKVPTLREFCQLIDPYKELLLNIEIKERTHETVDLSMGILQEFGLIERSVFTCFDAAIVEYMHDRYGVLCQGFPKEYMDNFRDGPDGTYSKLFAVGIAMKVAEGSNHRKLTPELVKEFEAMGIEPWCYCPDTDDLVEEAVRCGAKLMTCNNPLPALRILKEKKLHPRSIALPK
ncbi:MAG: glycerophosphodiester phosphodiesterase family protein [Angelakisella sp.]